MRAVFFFLLVSVFSCNENKTKKRSGSFVPTIVKAGSYWISKDSIAIPITIPVNAERLKKIPAGRPLIIPANNNIHIAHLPEIVIAGKPRIIVPDTDTFLLPKETSVIDSQATAAMPVSFVVKDMIYKNQDAPGFSFFGKQHGLKHGIVTCLLEDRIGNLWFGTAGGVTKYDGRSFTHYTEKEGLIYNDVRSILEDKSGNIWFGTNGGGVSRYDGRTFSHFTLNYGLNNNYVFSMCEDKSGNIWFGTWGGGVAKFNGHSFTLFTERNGLGNNYISAILEDGSGNIWFGTAGGVAKYDGHSFTLFTEKEGLGNNDVHSVLEDGTGNLWFGTENGVSRFDSRFFTNYTEKEGLIHNRVFSILNDQFGNLWFGTFNGISKFDGKSFTNFTDKEGLSNNNVYVGLEDRSGNLWFGTAGGGVSKFNQQVFTHFNLKHRAGKNFVTCILESRSGATWFGTWGGGITKYNGNSFAHFTEKEGLGGSSVRSLCEDKSGSLWVGTSVGISKYDGRVFTYFTDREGLVNNVVNYILEDRSDNLWFATDAGVTKFDGRSFQNFTEREGLSNNEVNCITEDRLGNLWFGTAGGVSKFDGKRFTNYMDKERVGSNNIYTIHEDKSGNFWFASYGGGVLKFDGNFITHFTEREGLISNFAGSIAEDRSGSLWFGTRFGISKLTVEKAAFFSERSKSGAIYESDVFFKNYGYADNFTGIGSTSNAILKSGDNTILIGTNAGVTAIDPSKEISDTTGPAIRITSVKLFNEYVDWMNLAKDPGSSFLLGNGIRVNDFRFDSLSNWDHLPQPLSLSYKNNYIGFDFTGIAMSQPQNMKYQYRLEGLDERMSSLTTVPAVSYGNLLPGTYTFRVRAMNSEGYWSSDFAYTFSIRSPWWKTWWFRILAVAAAFTMVLFSGRFIYIYQLRKQRVALEKQLALQYERQRISSDLHDDIGSTLSSINIYAGLAKKEVNKDSHLDSITQNISEVVNKLDDLVWSINPRYDSIISIINRLQSYAEPICHAKDIKFKIQNSLTETDLTLMTDVKQNIYLAAKELVNNSIKHSGCRNILVDFSRQRNILLLAVQDDGKGFDKDSVRMDRNGLTNISKRVAAIKGVVHTETRLGSGTKTIISIPV